MDAEAYSSKKSSLTSGGKRPSNDSNSRLNPKNISRLRSSCEERRPSDSHDVQKGATEIDSETSNVDLVQNSPLETTYGKDSIDDGSSIAVIKSNRDRKWSTKSRKSSKKSGSDEETFISASPNL